MCIRDRSKPKRWFTYPSGTKTRRMFNMLIINWVITDTVSSLLSTSSATCCHVVLHESWLVPRGNPFIPTLWSRLSISIVKHFQACPPIWEPLLEFLVFFQVYYQWASGRIFIFVICVCFILSVWLCTPAPPPREANSHHLCGADDLSLIHI